MVERAHSKRTRGRDGDREIEKEREHRGSMRVERGNSEGKGRKRGRREIESCLVIEVDRENGKEKERRAKEGKVQDERRKEEEEEGAEQDSSACILHEVCVCLPACLPAISFPPFLWTEERSMSQRS